MEGHIPGLRALRTYKREWLPRDLIAGFVLSALLVPQGMAYAELAGLPPITGLYTTVVALLAYAALGPSPFLVLGPDSSLGPMIAAVVLPLIATSGEEAITLAGMLAILVGLVCAGASLAKLGFVADLISKPVRVGYLAGLAVTIVIGQLPKLFGYSVDASGLFRELQAWFASLSLTNVAALAVGLIALGLIVGLRKFAPRAPGVLIAVVVGIVISSVLDLASRGVSVVGVLPQGFPRPSLPAAGLENIPLLFAAAIGISLVAIGDTISTSAGFAARKGYEVNSNQELMGIGAANLMAGVFQGFPVSTSSSRTAVAEQSGAKTQLTGLVAAGAVMVMLLFLPGLMRNLPQSALAAVIIAAAIRLFDYAEMRRLLRLRRSEFLLALASLLGVAFVGVLEGIVIAVLLSIFDFFRRAWRPYAAVLGKPEGVEGYHDMTRYPGAQQVPGLLIVRWNAPLFFANANIFREYIRKLVAETSPAPKWILVSAEPVTDIDTSAADVLVDLDLELNNKDIHLVFAEMKDPVKDKIVRYGLLETIDQRHFYPTIETAVEAYTQEVSKAQA
jgi:high affinity sulfate transporter 1